MWTKSDTEASCASGDVIRSVRSQYGNTDTRPVGPDRPYRRVTWKTDDDDEVCRLKASHDACRKRRPLDVRQELDVVAMRVETALQQATQPAAGAESDDAYFVP